MRGAESLGLVVFDLRSSSHVDALGFNHVELLLGREPRDVYQPLQDAWIEAICDRKLQQDAPVPAPVAVEV